MSHQVAPTVRPAPRANPGTGDRPGGRKAWVVTALLLALMMVNFADKAVLGLAHDQILADLGLDESEYGIISGGFFLLFSVTSVAVGFLADRFPAKRLLLWMALIWAASVVPVLGATGFGVLLASRVVLGAAEGPTFGVANHSVQKWFYDKDRNLPAAILTVGATLGVIVAAPVLSWVITAHGWRTAFGCLGAVGILWAIGWQLLGKDGPVGRDDAPAETAVASRLAGRRVPLRRLLTSGTYLGALAASAAAYVSLALLLAYLPAYLKGPLDYSSRAASLLFTLPWLMAAILVLGQGVLTRRLMVRGVSTRIARGVLGGVALLASAAFTVAFVHTHGAVQIACMTFAFSISGLIFAISTTVCGEIAPPAQRGSVLGIYVAIASLAGVVAPIVVGRLIDAAHTEAVGYDHGFTLMAAAMVVGGLIALAFVRPERDAQRLLAASRPDPNHTHN